MSGYATIEAVREGGWLTIWFNQPERRNPLSGELVAETLNALESVREDRSIRGIVFRGRGKVFSAGGDLKQFLAYNATAEREPVKAVSREIATLLDAVANQPQVTVAAVHGAAVAGGLGLVCACDYVIAEAGTKFALTETAIGLTPAQIAPFVINRVGMRDARRLMLTASRFGTEEGTVIGLVDEVADGDMDARLERLFEQVRTAAPGAIANLKALLRELPGRSRPEQVELAADSFTDALLSEEAREGVESFFEKRKPRWTEDT